MPDYKVKVSYTYSVQAINAEDALATVPIATRIRWVNAEGVTEIFNSAGEKVLTAKLGSKSKQKENYG